MLVPETQEVLLCYIEDNDGLSIKHDCCDAIRHVEKRTSLFCSLFAEGVGNLVPIRKQLKHFLSANVSLLESDDDQR